MMHSLPEGYRALVFGTSGAIGQAVTMQVCKNLILALASFSTASRLWTPPTRPEQPKRPDSGRSDTGQSHHTVQSAASVQSWTLC